MRVPNSTPIVCGESGATNTISDERQKRGVHFPSVNWCNMHDFPTPISPLNLKICHGSAQTYNNIFENILVRHLQEMLRSSAAHSNDAALHSDNAADPQVPQFEYVNVLWLVDGQCDGSELI